MRPFGFALDAASAGLDWLGGRVVLARVGDLVVVNFGVLAGLGTANGFGWMAALWVSQGLSPASLAALGIGGALCVVVGSWLAAQALDHRRLRARPRETLPAGSRSPTCIPTRRPCARRACAACRSTRRRSTRRSSTSRCSRP